MPGWIQQFCSHPRFWARAASQLAGLKPASQPTSFQSHHVAGWAGLRADLPASPASDLGGDFDLPVPAGAMQHSATVNRATPFDSDTRRDLAQDTLHTRARLSLAFSCHSW